MPHRFVLWLVLVCILWSPPRAESADRPAPFKERWHLEVLPEKVPQIAELLPGTSWVQHHPRTILGVGTGYAVRFPAQSERGAELHFTSTSYPSVNDREAGIVETTHKFPLAVEGPCLQYGGLVKTAFVTPGERLVLDAAVRVGENRWYQLSSRKLDRERGRKQPVEIKEYLFEFEGDPLESDEGKLTVTRHTRNLAEEKRETLRMPATFKLERRSSSGAKVRKLKLLAEVVERVRHNLPDLYFFGSPDFALLESSDHLYGTGIFEADKRK